MDSTKSVLEHVMPNLCSCFRWDLRVASCIPMLLGHETVMLPFSGSGGARTDSIKSPSGHITANLYFASDEIYSSRSAFRCV
jgi:hypothetical protein